MTHVFISYSSQHRELTKALVARLEAEHYPVWWDYALEAWGPYEIQIRQALQDAGAVIVIWSAGAARSPDWVRAEVERARHARKLVNVRAPDFPLDEVPSPYNAVDHIHTLDLVDLGPILKSVDTVWRGAVPTDVKPRHLSYRDRYGVELFAAKGLPRPTDVHELSPSALLQARYGFVDYIDTNGLLADMLDWCRNDGVYAEAPRATAGRLLFGPGGLGKTRLMIELVHRLREQGWLAGFADPPRRRGDMPEMIDREQSIAQVFAGGEEPGVLMVIDYAEGRQDEIIELARLARARSREGVRPVRVVLLARGDAWWPDLYGREGDVEILFQRFGHTYGDVKRYGNGFVLCTIAKGMG